VQSIASSCIVGTCVYDVLNVLLTLLQPNIHEYKLHVAQLVVVNICSGSPSDQIVRILQKLTSEAASPRRSEDRYRLHRIFYLNGTP